MSPEVPLPLAQLLQQPHGDFQASVCFHEFLYHLEPDARHLAYGIIHGDTLEEMRRSAFGAVSTPAASMNISARGWRNM